MKNFLSDLSNPFFKLAIFTAIFFGALWANLGFDGALWAVGLLFNYWLNALSQMNLMVVAFSLVVGMIGVMWVLRVKQVASPGEGPYDRMYTYISLGIFAAIAGILVAVVLA